LPKIQNYALAYGGLAKAYLLLLDRGWIPHDEASPKIRSAAQRAIELDPTLAEPHAALAALREADWDWAGAEVEYRKAIGLNRTTPHPTIGTRFCYRTWVESGRHWLRMRRPWRSTQLLPRINANHAGILVDLHRYDDAMAELNRLTAANPEFRGQLWNPRQRFIGTWEIRMRTWQMWSWP